MTVAKVIEVISEGETIEDAIQTAVREVAKTVKNVKQIDVMHIKGIVEKNKVKKYSVNCNITFVVDR